MKVQRLQKMQLKKATIAKISETTAMLIKGGTRSFEPSHDPKSGLESHCGCLLYTSPSPRDAHESRMPSSA